MKTYLEFEKPIIELESKIDELRHLTGARDADIANDIQKLQAKVEKLLRQTYTRLTPWQKVQVARHVERPHALNYIHHLIEDFIPLAGDRVFAEDRAIVGGLGRFRGRPVVIMGHEKGHDTESRIKHSFGMAKPEGYRKAVRLMKLAESYNLPVITLVDTAGAYPGIEAEERGQSEALGRCLQTCLDLQVPIVSVVIGEGGSGGAVALATANRIYMLEHAIYSVITPEGCASILWRSRDKAAQAAEAQKLTAQDILALGLIDAIITEPLGGAHRDPALACAEVGRTIESALSALGGLDGLRLRDDRRQKFMRMGQPS